MGSDCVFRNDIRQEGSEVTADCGLVRALAGGLEPVRVSEQVCRQCEGGSIVEAVRANGVLPSLVYDACGRRLKQLQVEAEVGGQRAANDEQSRLQRLIDTAEQELLIDSHGGVHRKRSWACDVIVPVLEPSAGASTESFAASIQSLLDQRSMRTVVHLIGGDELGNLANSLENPRQVIWHRAEPGWSLGRLMHRVIGSLRTEFVAWHQIGAISEKMRLREAIESLWLNGSELWLAAVRHGDQVATSSADDFSSALSVGSEARRTLASLVCRRATLIDLGGFSDTDDATCDLVSRALAEDRPVTFSDRVVIDAPPEQDRNAADRWISWSGEPATNPTRVEPIGFPQSRVACDVILPFHNHFDYVEQSMEGLVNQDNADVTIHLVDDASTEDSTALIGRWRGDPRVRCYRNRTNIGQFMSLNNLSEFCDTGLIAVQDADDISLPNRIVTAGNYLRRCDADYFGGAVELFGEDRWILPVPSETDDLHRTERSEQRESFYPPAMSIPYFIENPTAVFRRDMFRQLGGYADFGTREMNRSSLDSEFLLRCFFSGVRFTITKQVMTRYRVHADSATQNRITGWGTVPRTTALQLVQQHTRVFRAGLFDPRVFGSIGRFAAETERIE